MNRAEQKILREIKSLKPGDTFQDDGYKCHIVANLKKDDRIVFKHYGKHKRHWHYHIEHYYWFELKMLTNEQGTTLGNRRPIEFKRKKR